MARLGYKPCTMVFMSQTKMPLLRERHSMVMLKSPLLLFQKQKGQELKLVSTNQLRLVQVCKQIILGCKKCQTQSRK